MSWLVSLCLWFSELSSLSRRQCRHRGNASRAKPPDDSRALPEVRAKCREKNDDSIKLTIDDDDGSCSSQVVQNMTREEMMMELPSGCFNFRFQGAFDLENQKDRL